MKLIFFLIALQEKVEQVARIIRSKEEALISLRCKRAPRLNVVAQALIRPPFSQIGPIEPSSASVLFKAF
jgi:hypothetical protein